jgi:hypothetical protein
MKKNIFISIQESSFEHPANIADLNRNGVGFYSVNGDKDLEGKVILLDLVSDKNRAIIRSLSARVVFACETTQHETDTATTSSKRYGLKFVNLSALEKRVLDLITKKYALA